LEWTSSRRFEQAIADVFETVPKPFNAAKDDGEKGGFEQMLDVPE
jgi:hypothetical protein